MRELEKKVQERKRRRLRNKYSTPRTSGWRKEARTLLWDSKCKGKGLGIVIDKKGNDADE